MKFYILLDDDFEGEIIKFDGENYYRFVYGPNEWVHTKLFNKYLDKSSEYFDKYKEISEKETIDFLVEQINLYQRLWNKAYDLALEKHKDAIDKLGKPYILHPLYVSEKFDVYDFKIVAILHDIIEDTDVNLKDLEKMGFPKKITKAIDCISRKKTESYFEYIDRVKTNGIAKIVKIEDLKHNLLPERINLVKNNESLIKRYKKALKILSE